MRLSRFSLDLTVDLYAERLEGTSHFRYVSDPDGQDGLEANDTDSRFPRLVRVHCRQCKVRAVRVCGLPAKFELRDYFGGGEVVRNDEGYRDLDVFSHYNSEAMDASEAGELVISVPAEVVSSSGPAGARRADFLDVEVDYELSRPNRGVRFLRSAFVCGSGVGGALGAHGGVETRGRIVAAPLMFTETGDACGGSVVGGSCGPRTWMPCVDTLTQRCPCELRITVPQGMVAVATGELTGTVAAGAGVTGAGEEAAGGAASGTSADKGTNGTGGSAATAATTTTAMSMPCTTFTYTTAEAIPAYAIGIAVGPFAVHADRVMPERLTHFAVPLPGVARALPATADFRSAAASAVELFASYLAGEGGEGASTTSKSAGAGKDQGRGDGDGGSSGSGVVERKQQEITARERKEREPRTPVAGGAHKVVFVPASFHGSNPTLATTEGHGPLGAGRGSGGDGNAIRGFGAAITPSVAERVFGATLLSLARSRAGGREKANDDAAEAAEAAEMEAASAAGGGGRGRRKGGIGGDGGGIGGVEIGGGGGGRAFVVSGSECADASAVNENALSGGRGDALDYCPGTSFASLSLLDSSSLMHSARTQLDRGAQSDEAQARGVAFEWFGSLVGIEHWRDAWLLHGLTGHLVYLYIRRGVVRRPVVVALDSCFVLRPF